MTNTQQRLHRTLVLFLSVIIFLSFWLFSRFTVDDAFISWRYGKNLVDFGIWNYNPAIFDMTQAYTNPIFAVLSIIPNFFKIDVVLFFKLFAIFTLVVFFYWFTRKAKDKNSLIMTLIFFALPATFVHAFSGLETFLFTALMASLLILLFEERFYSSILISLLLFFTRPEAWPLVILIPLYILTIHLEYNNQGKDLKSISSTYKEWRLFSWRRFVLAFLLLFIPLAMYFIFHKLHFGNALPNTFYIKSGGSLSTFSLIFFSYCVLPFIILIPLKKIRLFIFSSLIFGAMIVSYSTSTLLMDYVGRFSFHIFAPVYFFVVYIASKQTQNFLYVSSTSNPLEGSFKISFQMVINIVLLLFLLPFAQAVTKPSELAAYSDYYPRAIDSHAALGKTLQTITEKYNLKSFSFGDAGIAAYHSKLISLDNIGLASSAVAASGVTLALLDAYHPDITVFHAKPEGIGLKDHYQETIHQWSLANGMKMVCDIYWQPAYTLRVFAEQAYPEIVDICNQSEQRNNQEHRAYFLKTGANPPWSYWKE